MNVKQNEQSSKRIHRTRCVYYQIWYKKVKTDFISYTYFFLNKYKMSSIQSKINQIEKILAEMRVSLKDESPEVSKLDKKKAELAELEAKLTSKTPDKDEEKKIKIREQIAKMESPPVKKTKAAAEKPVVVEKVEEDTVKKTVAAKAEVRVPRLMGPLLESFKAAMKENGLEATADTKKAFMTYANAMSADEYAGNNLETHMKNYASKPTVTTVDELHKLNADLEEVSVGLYRNKKTKCLLTGPPELNDEEFDDAIHEKSEYVMGQTTRRVYSTNPDGPDEFVGYWTVGKFYDAAM